jgi:hypothetical protein
LLQLSAKVCDILPPVARLQLDRVPRGTCRMTVIRAGEKKLLIHEADAAKFQVLLGLR